MCAGGMFVCHPGGADAGDDFDASTSTNKNRRTHPHRNPTTRPGWTRRATTTPLSRGPAEDAALSRRPNRPSTLRCRKTTRIHSMSWWWTRRETKGGRGPVWKSFKVSCMERNTKPNSQPWKPIWNVVGTTTPPQTQTLPRARRCRFQRACGRTSRPREISRTVSCKRAQHDPRNSNNSATNACTRAVGIPICGPLRN